jgi:hypothetical protein
MEPVIITIIVVCAVVFTVFIFYGLYRIARYGAGLGI